MMNFKFLLLGLLLAVALLCTVKADETTSVNQNQDPLAQLNNDDDTQSAQGESSITDQAVAYAVGNPNPNSAQIESPQIEVPANGAETQPQQGEKTMFGQPASVNNDLTSQASASNSGKHEPQSQEKPTQSVQAEPSSTESQERVQRQQEQNVAPPVETKAEENSDKQQSGSPENKQVPSTARGFMSDLFKGGADALQTGQVSQQSSQEQQNSQQQQQIEQQQQQTDQQLPLQPPVNVPAENLPKIIEGNKEVVPVPPQEQQQPQSQQQQQQQPSQQQQPGNGMSNVTAVSSARTFGEGWTNCVGASGGKYGSCKNDVECKKNKGEPDGSCMGGLGVCCVMALTCGDKSFENNTFFANPDFPEPSWEARLCEVEIKKKHEKKISQIMIEFEEFELAPPNHEGECITDVFEIKLASNRQSPYSLLRICGQNTGQHMYLDVSQIKEPLVLSVATSGGGYPRRWSIRIVQMDDKNYLLAPPGCLQYYTDTVGHFRSFNLGRNLKNLYYAVCFRIDNGYSGIRFTSNFFGMNGPQCRTRKLHELLQGHNKPPHPGPHPHHLVIPPPGYGVPPPKPHYRPGPPPPPPTLMPPPPPTLPLPPPPPSYGGGGGALYGAKPTPAYGSSYQRPTPANHPPGNQPIYRSKRQANQPQQQQSQQQQHTNVTSSARTFDHELKDFKFDDKKEHHLHPHHFRQGPAPPHPAYGFRPSLPYPSGPPSYGGPPPPPPVESGYGQNYYSSPPPYYPNQPPPPPPTYYPQQFYQHEGKFGDKFDFKDDKKEWWKQPKLEHKEDKKEWFDTKWLWKQDKKDEKFGWKGEDKFGWREEKKDDKWFSKFGWKEEKKDDKFGWKSEKFDHEDYGPPPSAVYGPPQHYYGPPPPGYGYGGPSGGYGYGPSSGGYYHQEVDKFGKKYEKLEHKHELNHKDKEDKKDEKSWWFFGKKEAKKDKKDKEKFFTHHEALFPMMRLPEMPHCEPRYCGANDVITFPPSGDSISEMCGNKFNRGHGPKIISGSPLVVYVSNRGNSRGAGFDMNYEQVFYIPHPYQK